jgi:hypothetical protein
MRFDVPLPVRTIVHCTNCKRPVELELEGTSGVAGYDTFNPYHCPHCRKLNQPRTAGRILAARIAEQV